ncbi:MAG: hypothetical protein EA360_05520 [Balneolaceae bacterium]|nr:MAG: hypothetical protein EA360_05520 [Balneolaceae bacterium]
MKRVYFFILTLTVSLFATGCGKPSTNTLLQECITFFASFDQDLGADYAFGNNQLFTSPSWSLRGEAVPLDSLTFPGQLEIHRGEGRYRDALWIDSRYEPVFFYEGENNFHLSETVFAGTLSFWLRLDPDVTLHPGFSDPVQITSRSWNDGALFVDFTDRIPREFRFAIFPDRTVWDPLNLEWDDVPENQRPMIGIRNHPFSMDTWTHVAIAFENFNSGKPDGIVKTYLNGVFTGSLSEREMTFSWNPSEVKIWIGYNYRGYLDELILFNRSLTAEEVMKLYSLENGISDLLP